MRFTPVSTPRRIPQSEAGFTLIELMVVVGIAAVCLATVLTTPDLIAREKAREAVETHRARHTLDLVVADQQRGPATLRYRWLGIAQRQRAADEHAALTYRGGCSATSR
jgi:prepilin-type N-terminal cleavage/methylation domain-containing protein